MNWLRARELVWHDMENDYEEDLPFYLDLAPARIVEFGAGTGRVSVPLAKAGCKVLAVDSDSLLLDELVQRADGLDVTTMHHNALVPMNVATYADHVIAPAQFVQMFTTEADRVALLAAARAAMKRGGTFTTSIHPDLRDAQFGPGEEPEPERRGRLTSQPIRWNRERVGVLRITRERRDETIDMDDLPSGSATSALFSIDYADLSVEQLEREAAVVGMKLVKRDLVQPTEDHLALEVLRFRLQDG